MNAKIYNGNVQPNHKEYKIWVNDEGAIKTWNGTEWIEQSGGSGESGGGGSNSGDSGSSGDKLIYYEVTDGTAVDSPDYQTVQSVAASVKILIEGVGYIFGKFWRSDASGDNEIPYLKAFAFAPIDVDVEADNQKVYTNFQDFETVCQNMDIPFEQIVKRRITAEEYWNKLIAD